LKPAPFEYLAATSVDEALSWKSQYGDEARFLAGGQSLVPAMNFRLAQPAVLIDINPIPSHDGIAVETGRATIGMLTRYRALERSADIACHQPLLGETVPNVAHPQVRNRGTLAGNLAHADPASELPAVMLASNATLIAQSVRGRRRIAAREFFLNLYTTALESDEMLVAIELPALAPMSGTAFIEVSRRRGDYAMMGVAAVVTMGAGGKCVEARIVCCNAGPTPMPLDAAAAALKDTTLDDGAIAHAARLAPGEIDPAGNVNASVAFQRHLAAVLTRRALALAAERARAVAGVPA
jgi:carbon-monoxide dehydrogenase medium subunit